MAPCLSAAEGLWGGSAHHERAVRVGFKPSLSQHAFRSQRRYSAIQRHERRVSELSIEIVQLKLANAHQHDQLTAWEQWWNLEQCVASSAHKALVLSTHAATTKDAQAPLEAELGNMAESASIGDACYFVENCTEFHTAHRAAIVLQRFFRRMYRSRGKTSGNLIFGLSKRA